MFEFIDDDVKWPSFSVPLLNLFTFGSIEDGRCGYAALGKEVLQLSPRPVATLRASGNNKFVVKLVATGGRHTLAMLIDSTDEIPPPVKVKPKTNRFDDEEEDVPWVPKRKLRRMLVTGLNQAALCEEEGHDTFTDVAWDCELDPPERLFAGNGTSYFITRLGYVYSFGRGHFGILGHGNTESYHMPRQISSLNRSAIMKIATGGAHVVALSLDDVLFSWGRNNKGQLGRGFESDYESSPGLVVFASLTKYKILDVACGAEHSLAWVNITNSNVNDNHKLFAWGDESRGQLGSGDAVNRMRPQENRWFTKFLRKNQISMDRILAGGYHNLVLVKYSGQVISWGANEYGQLGNGNQWDDATPKFINNLKDVYDISAGLRHNVCVVKSHSIDVMGWGYNNFGELGLGDTDIRLQPSKITAFKNAQVLQVSCGDRHTAVVTSHIPLTAKEDATLKPYFKILEVEKNNKPIMRRLKVSMERGGLDPGLLDDPDKVLPHQAGSADRALINDSFDQGLRYCLDTKSDKFDWRRKALEACYECNLKTMKLDAVCLSCARNCLKSYRLRPKIRSRVKGDKCDCVLSGLCVSRWNELRNFFDKFVEEDNCIGPNQVKALLKTIRSPYPVDNADVEDCLLTVADGREDSRMPRIFPVPFEKWYRKFYDEKEVEEGEIVGGTGESSYA